MNNVNYNISAPEGNLGAGGDASRSRHSHSPKNDDDEYFRPRPSPKPRNVFTISSVLENSESSFANNVMDRSHPSTMIDADGSGESLQGRRTHTQHGSMENLFKPKNHRSSASASSGRRRSSKRSNSFTSDADREALERMTEENLMLATDLEKMRKSASLYKTIATFSYAAFRTHRRKSDEFKQCKEEKEKEAAARKILHTFLLNNWRQNKAKLVEVTDENDKLKKTNENLNIQIRVVRHIQTMEKNKFTDKMEELERSKVEIKKLKAENLAKQESMEQIENEFNTLQAKVQNLDDLNKMYATDAVLLKDTIKALESSLDSERMRTLSNEKRSRLLAEESQRLQDQLSHLSMQCKHWQEQERTRESEVCVLRNELDVLDTRFKGLQNLHDALKKEKADLMRTKANMKDQVKHMREKLNASMTDIDDLSKKLKDANADIEEHEKQVEVLQDSLEETKLESNELQKQLFSYTLMNVKRRRMWLNRLYFVFYPLDAFRRYLMECSESNNFKNSKCME